jgi:hypothetical protein
VSFTEAQQREGINYNYHQEPGFQPVDKSAEMPSPDGTSLAAALAGTDVSTFTRERPGFSAFLLEGERSITPIRLIHGDWMFCGMHKSGLTVHRKDETRPTIGGAATMSTKRSQKAKHQKTTTANKSICGKNIIVNKKQNCC